LDPIDEGGIGDLNFLEVETYAAAAVGEEALGILGGLQGCPVGEGDTETAALGVLDHEVGPLRNAVAYRPQEGLGVADPSGLGLHLALVGEDKAVEPEVVGQTGADDGGGGRSVGHQWRDGGLHF
jgi:hypothetical protein